MPSHLWCHRNHVLLPQKLSRLKLISLLTNTTPDQTVNMALQCVPGGWEVNYASCAQFHWLYAIRWNIRRIVLSAPSFLSHQNGTCSFGPLYYSERSKQFGIFSFQMFRRVPIEILEHNCLIFLVHHLRIGHSSFLWLNKHLSDPVIYLRRRAEFVVWWLVYKLFFNDHAFLRALFRWFDRDDYCNGCTLTSLYQY